MSVNLIKKSQPAQDTHAAGEVPTNKVPLVTRIKALLIMIFIVSLNSFLRVTKTGSTDFVDGKQLDKPVLVASWHGTLIVPICCFRALNLVIMSSLSNDGELLAKILNHLKYLRVRGSSSRGGMRGLLEMIRLVKSGKNASLTVDGPRGPRHEVKPGMVLVAQKTGGYVLPVGVAFSHCVTLKTWDQTKIPLPFSRVVVHSGRPFTISSEVSAAEGSEMIKQALFESDRQAEIFLKNGKSSEI